MQPACSYPHECSRKKLVSCRTFFIILHAALVGALHYTMLAFNELPKVLVINHKIYAKINERNNCTNKRLF